MLRYLLAPLLLVFLIKFSQAQWDWVNPSPQGNDLNCIVYAGNKTLLAAGNFGTILRSINNGQDWSHVESGSEIDIRDIEFYDANNGIAVGDSGLVILTSNGGMDWEIIDLKVNARLWAVAYSDSLNITIAGYDGYIFHSADGGYTWNNISPPVLGDFLDVTFITPEKGFITGMNEDYYALILKTEDGGQNWTVALNGTFGSLYSMSFRDELNGYAAGGDGDVIHTSDGGNTWVLCPELDYPIMKILAFQGDWIFAVSVYKEWMRSAEYIKQWVFLNQDEDRSARNICTGTANEIWVAGLAGRLKYTPDLGETIIDLSSGVFDHFIDISFPSNQNGFILGYDNLLISKDGGIEWDIVPLTGIGQYDGSPCAVSWVNATIAYLLTQYGGVFRTTDGGQSWQSILKAGKAQWYSDICMTDASHGFLVGGGASPGGALWSLCMRTTTGFNWTSVNIPVGLPLSKVYFNSENIGFILGMGGSLLKTFDGGNSWVVKDVPVDSDLQDIFFTDINTGYMIASGYWDTHYILKTTDGGENWNIVYELGNVYHHYRLVSIYFVDETNGIVVGDPGLILSTSDGGYSWKKETAITDNSLQGGYMKSNQDAMVVGYNSTILGKGSMQNLPDNSQKDENLLVCFPNPGGEYIIASFSAMDLGQVVIRIQDVCGKVLMNKSVSINQPGKQNIRLDCSEIPSGVHFLSIKTQSRLYTSKVLLIH